MNTKLMAAIFACAAGLLAGSAMAGGEAGAITLRDQGFFWVGANTKPVERGPWRQSAGPGHGIEGQMYVGFQLLAKKRHPYPLVLVHGGGGQATDWMGTPDGRDGWMDYFLAAGSTSITSIARRMAVHPTLAPMASWVRLRPPS